MISWRRLKKMIEIWVITRNLSPEERGRKRAQRRRVSAELGRTLIRDLLVREEIGDIVLDREDRNLLHQLKIRPVLSRIEEIYKRYL
jgi:hypothetical protein